MTTIKGRLKGLCATLLFLLAASHAFSQAYSAQTFSLSNGALIALSKDGSTVLQSNGYWTPAGGSVAYGGPGYTYNSVLTGISRDGSIMSGGAVEDSDGAYEPFTITQSFYGTFPGAPSNDQGPLYNLAYGISGDGSTLLTYDYSTGAFNNSNTFSRTWTAGGGYNTYFTSAPGTIMEGRPVCSDDGVVVAWTEYIGSNTFQVWVKQRSGQVTMVAQSATGAYATAMSPDGSVIWGYDYDSLGNETAFRYQTGVGFEYTEGFIPLAATDDSFVASGLWQRSPHGLYSAGLDIGGTAYDLTDFLTGNGLSLGNSILGQPFISGDGTHVACNDNANNQGIYVTMPGFAAVANNDSYTVQPNVLTSFNASQGVLSNDQNVYGGTAQLVTGPSDAASFTLNTDGSFSYQSNAGYGGTDSFTYQIDRDLTVSNTATVTINIQPTLVGIVPGRIPAGGPAFALAVKGGPFTPDAQVTLNGAPYATTFLNSGRLSVTVPAGLIATPNTTITVGAMQASGASPTQGLPVQYPLPTIASLSPNQAAPGGIAFTLTVYGAGFYPASTVKWNNVSLETTYVSNSELQAAVPSSGIALAGGTYSVTVTNPKPAGGTSDAATFTTTGGLHLAVLYPNSVAQGSQTFTLKLTGSAFANGAVVMIGSTALATTFVNSQTLNATVPASVLATAGDNLITVVNPGNNVSNSRHFYVSAAN